MVRKCRESRVRPSQRDGSLSVARSLIITFDVGPQKKSNQNSCWQWSIVERRPCLARSLGTLCRDWLCVCQPLFWIFDSLISAPQWVPLNRPKANKRNREKASADWHCSNWIDWCLLGARRARLGIYYRCRDLRHKLTKDICIYYTKAHIVNSRE